MDSRALFLTPCSNKKYPEMINQEERSIGESMRVKKRKGIILSKPRRTKLRNRSADSSSSSTSSSSTPSNHIRGLNVKIDGKRRKNSRKDGNFEDLALPIGMSFAAIISQVLGEINRSRKKIPVEQLSLICTSTIKESVANIYGNRFDSFLLNFEKSFGSTLRTLWTIKEASVLRHQFGSSQILNKAENVAHVNDQISADEVKKQLSSLPNNRSSEILQDIPSLIMETNQIVPYREVNQELASGSHNLSVHRHDQSVMSTFEKSVVELARSNDLKAFEIDLIIRKLKLEESQLAVSTYANDLEKVKISMGTVKASFKEEKLRNQMLDSRHAEFLRRCSDLLVSGLIVMCICLGYGAYTFSYQRITDATQSCSATSKGSSSSWFGLTNPMASFNSSFQIIRCQVFTFSRFIFGLAMIMAIAYAVFQRSSMNTPTTMPVTFMLLLGFMCGFAGKFCVDTLGGNGYYWLLHWETLCLVHCLANIFPSIFYRMLYGSISVTTQMKAKGSFVPYWTRRLAFNLLLSIVCPAMCGLLPFASFKGWKTQISEKFNYVSYVQG